VLGITFMLFVTVSVLQLREVLHPDIFAAVIRPQEPHPDLLGSLLQVHR
jgi:E3 ubiquitin-protein ligase MARCH6